MSTKSDQIHSVGGLVGFDELAVVATIQGATGGTLDIYLQTYDGTNWIDMIHFAQLAGAAASSVKVFLTTKNAASGATAITVGTNTTPALAANSIVPGMWFDKIRTLYVSGAGTSAGAAQSIVITGIKRAPA